MLRFAVKVVTFCVSVTFCGVTVTHPSTNPTGLNVGYFAVAVASFEKKMKNIG